MKMSRKQKGYIQLAINMSKQSSCKFQHGAVLVKGGTIVNASYNKPEYNSFASRFNEYYPTRHAEIGAILGISRNSTKGSVVYVIRVNNFGETRCSKPCPMCQKVMKFCGVKKVYYSTSVSEEIGCLKL